MKMVLLNKKDNLNPGFFLTPKIVRFGPQFSILIPEIAKQVFLLKKTRGPIILVLTSASVSTC